MAFNGEFAIYQLIGGGDAFSSIIFFVLFFIFIFFYPRLMIMQVLWNLERTASTLEGYTQKGKSVVIKKISKKPDRNLREAVTNFLEFFMIEPVSLDPYGIVKKFEHLSDLSEKRFQYFVKNVAPKTNPEEQANLVMGLAGAVSLHQIAKIVRHFVELVRKTKNLQLAMLLQMQLPLIERISKALLKGTEALANGWPIGDSFGPYTASRMIGDKRGKEIEEDTLMVSKKIKGKQVMIIRAKGPGGRLGKLGKAVEKLVKKNKIAKIITIDAAAKLEGEKTGSIAEGIGVAIGGIGVDRSYIENISTSKGIPLDSFVVKMSQEEAIMPMKTEILNAADKMIKRVEENISKTKEKGKIIVVGVGNCSGIGNTEKEARKAEEQIKKIAKELKREEEEEEKRRKSFFSRLTGG